MRIASVASAFPDLCFAQDEIQGALTRYWGDKLENPELLGRFHSRVGVESRHLAFPLEMYDQFSTWGETNSAWLQVAQDLGEKAIDAALDRAGLERRDIDALFVVSITGIASPSLDARLINRMRLRPDIKRTPIFGLGCVGGAIGLTRAVDYVLAYPKQNAVLLAVEICSLTLQRDDLSTANLISSALFADGAAAAIVTGSERPPVGPQIVSTRSVFYPGTEELMGWNISEKGFRIVLSPRLPEMIKRHLADDIDAFLVGSGLGRRDIGRWIIHTGGPRVLRSIEDALDLSRRELAVSWECLRHFGNVSSASVLLVLEEVIMRQAPEPGTLGLVMAVGPGFCSELLLLRW